MAELIFRTRSTYCMAMIWKQSKIFSSCIRKQGNLMILTPNRKYSDEPEKSIQEINNYLEGKRKAFWGRRRQLSPLHRVSEMIKDSKGEEQSNEKQDDEISGQKGEVTIAMDDDSKKDFERKLGQEISNSVHPNQILIDGMFVFVVMENVKTNVTLKTMFLLEAGRRFNCRYGSLEHTDIIGHLPGKIFLTDEDYPVLVRRPTLEEYVLHMKRTATISYPKDCSAMLMMIDASPGDIILEAGTGSGAMSLFLSRAVWTEGTIHSYEVNRNHQGVAKRNIQAWQRSHNISHPDNAWPDNICFHLQDLQDTCMKDGIFDGAVIDLEEPHLVLPALADKLKRGRAAAIYVSNLSQVIDIAELIRIKELALLVEDVIDVTHKHWLVHPARRRQATRPLDRLKVLRGSDVALEESNTKETVAGKDAEAYIIDHVPKYITRPRHNQPSFSAFLIKLIKILPSDLKCNV